MGGNRQPLERVNVKTSLQQKANFHFQSPQSQVKLCFTKFQHAIATPSVKVPKELNDIPNANKIALI